MPESRSENILIIVDFANFAEPCFFVFQDSSEKFALPRYSGDGDTDWHKVERVNHTVKHLTGLTVTTIQCLYQHLDKERSLYTNYYVLENHSMSGHTNLGKWIEQSDIDPRSFVHQDEYETIQRWLQWLQTCNSLRVPWYLPLWYRRFERRLAERVQEQLGLTVISMEQTRTWERSCMVKIRTEQGILFYKAVPKMFAREPRLSLWLCRIFPEMIPTVVDLFEDDLSGHQLILADYQGIGLNHRTSPLDLPLWEKTLQVYARIQITVKDRTDELLEHGCALRPVRMLIESMDQLFADVAYLTTGDYSIDSSEVTQLQLIAPDLKRFCIELDQCGIPLTLEHGDLWSGQCAVCSSDSSSHRIVITDWSDASITHPFLSVPYFLEDIEDELPEVRNARDHLRNIYLEEWKAFGDAETLQKAFRCALFLAPLHNAVLYYTEILRGMEHPWEMRRMFVRHLRMILRVYHRESSFS